MFEAESCPKCGVPRFITEEHLWLDGGVVTQSRDRRNRLVFFESENFDSVYCGIEELIGMPIERIVIDASRRSTHAYISRFVPKDVQGLIKERKIELETMIDAMLSTSCLMGYGNPTLQGLRFNSREDDFVTIRVAEPYSLPLFCGNIAGTVEVLVEGEPGVSYKEASPGIFDITVFRSENPAELKKRLQWKIYQENYKDGGIEFEKCETCGGPAALSEYAWDLDRGVIRSTHTGRRMAMLGPAMLDPIFEALEEELGDAIPRVVVEAQRRFVRSGFYSVEEVGSEENMRVQLALRGLGNLKELKVGRRGVRVYLENAALHLLGVGLTQGLFELAFGIESEVEWELSEEGDLEVEVTPRT
jgi:hypothetical protein